MADLTSKIKLLIQSQDGANQDAKLFPILPIPATVGDALTCSRALATATRVNSAGAIETVAANMPRITWELGVDQCPNLLVEKTRINYAPYSQTLSSYSTYLGTKVGGQVDIHGQLNAMLVYPSSTGAAAGQLYFVTPTSPTIGTVVCSSWEVKYAGKQWVYVGVVDGTSGAAGAYFDILNGVIGTITAGYTAGMYAEGSGYVVWISKATTSTSNYPLVGSSDNDNSNINTVVGTNGVIASNPQFEVGTIPTSRIITGASAVTANADVISKTGIGTLLAGAKGLFVDCYLQAGSLSDGVVYSSLYLTDGTNDTFYQFYRFNNIISLFSRVSTVIVASISSTIITPFRNKRIKLFIHIEENNLKFYVNGALAGVDTSATIPTLNTIWVGKENSTYWDGLIKAVAVTDEFTEADIEQISSYPSFANMAEQMVYEMV
jgi:hypothetical protein